MKQDLKVVVLGSGSWATAIVKILSQNIKQVGWWIREDDIRSNLKHFGHNPVYLSTIQFSPKSLILFDDIKKAVEHAQIVVLCIPAAFVDSALNQLDKKNLEGKILCSAVKGVIPETNTIVADYLEQRFQFNPDNVVIVTGPSHAEEVAQEKLTYLTVASRLESNASLIADIFNCRFIKTSLSTDIYGTEYAPVLKNIMALASGICFGLGYGDNFQAVLISNAIKEMERFLLAVHLVPREITSSVYLGDLLVTAYSQFSRNRLFGNMIGKGYSVKSAQVEMKMIAEGYYAARCIHLMNADLKVEMPICEAVYAILYENQSPAEQMKILSEKLS